MPKICKLAIGSVNTASGNSPAAAATAAAAAAAAATAATEAAAAAATSPCNRQHSYIHTYVCALAIRMPPPPIEASEINYTFSYRAEVDVQLIFGHLSKELTKAGNGKGKGEGKGDGDAQWPWPKQRPRRRT